MAIAFNETLFRSDFPEFSSVQEYSSSLLSSKFRISKVYISDEESGRLSTDERLHLLNLMVAHLLKISDIVTLGDRPNFVTQSSQTKGGVSVSILPPDGKDGFAWWLNHTAYGQEINALLSVNSVVGFYIGGAQERGAFRKFGGVF